MLYTLFAVVVVCVFLLLRWTYSYWERNGVPGPKPIFVVGNMGSALAMRKHIGVVLQDWYK